jgi:hypothetical protein
MLDSDLYILDPEAAEIHGLQCHWLPRSFGDPCHVYAHMNFLCLNADVCSYRYGPRGSCGSDVGDHTRFQEE